MKRTFALTAVTALVLGLTACASESPQEPAAGGLKCELPEAKLKSKIEVRGAKGQEPEIKADLSGESVKEYQRVAVEKGDGEAVVADPDVIYSMRITVATPTGEIVVSEPVEATLDPATSGMVEWVGKAAVCASDTGRVIAVGAAETLLPGQADGSNGKFTAESALITVIDMGGKAKKLSADAILKQAEGAEVPLPEGFPEVTFDAATGPKIVIPEGLERPQELKIATMIEGNGETVAEGANVYLHYRGVIWSKGEEFDASWTRGAHTNFKTNAVIKGFSKALVGQKVGSRVVALVDPESGYGAEWLQQRGYEENDVMVFVLDILGVENPGA